MKKQKKHHGGPAGNVTRFELPKGLSTKEAVKKAVRKVGGDFRGFTYNAKTGRATVC